MRLLGRRRRRARGAAYQCPRETSVVRTRRYRGDLSDRRASFFIDDRSWPRRRGNARDASLSQERGGCCRLRRNQRRISGLALRRRRIGPERTPRAERCERNQNQAASAPEHLARTAAGRGGRDRRRRRNAPLEVGENSPALPFRSLGIGPGSAHQTGCPFGRRIVRRAHTILLEYLFIESRLFPSGRARTALPSGIQILKLDFTENQPSVAINYYFLFHTKQSAR